MGNLPSSALLLRGPHLHAAVFANRIDDLRLQDLAEMDGRELVIQVQEFFGDFEVIDQHHFAINLPRPHVALQPFNWEFANRCGTVLCSDMPQGIVTFSA